jgi:O-antigen/teichoic acid export membrane protein
LRGISLARQDLAHVLRLDSAALVLMAGLLGIAVLRHVVDAPAVFASLIWTNGACIMLWLIFYRRELRFELAGAFPHLLSSLAFGRWAFAVAALTSAPYYLTPWFVMVFRGPEETAIFAAASTVVGIANHSFLGLTKGLEARTANAYASEGFAGLSGVLASTMSMVMPALLTVVLGLVVCAHFLGLLILPAHAHEVAAVVPILALSLFAGSIRVVVGNGFWAMGRPETTLASALVRGVTSVVLGIAGAYWAGALGCAVAFLAGDVLSCAVITRQFQSEKRAQAA